MMKQEFESLAGYEVSIDDYNKIIEPMYMATNLTKEEFVKTINKKRFALKPLKSIIKEMKQIAKEIETGCTHYYTYDLENNLRDLVNEYIRRKYEGYAKYVSFYFDSEMKQSCFYIKQVEIYTKDYYNTLEKIDLI